MLDARSLFAAAETRRRELPVSVALIILTGGIGAAVLENGAAIGWAALVSLLLVADAEIYRRIEQSEPAPESTKATFWRLCAWSAFASGIFASLPAFLVIDGAGAAVTAAMVLLIAGVVRLCGPGLSGGAGIALAGATPLAATLLAFPVLLWLGARPDWDAAFIAVLGGGAVMAFAAHSRLRHEGEARQQLAELAAEMAANAAIHLETIAAFSAVRTNPASRDQEVRKSA